MLGAAPGGHMRGRDGAGRRASSEGMEGPWRPRNGLSRGRAAAVTWGSAARRLRRARPGDPRTRRPDALGPWQWTTAWLGSRSDHSMAWVEIRTDAGAGSSPVPPKATDPAAAAAAAASTIGSRLGGCAVLNQTWDGGDGVCARERATEGGLWRAAEPVKIPRQKRRKATKR